MRVFNKMRTACLSTLAATLMLPVASIACDLHDNPSFGAYGQLKGFGQSHPLMQRHFAASSPAVLSMTHPRQVSSKVAEAKSVDIKYHLPAAYSDASLRFTYSDGIELNAQESVEIDELNGTYTIDFKALTPGKHHILVWADAVKQTLPFSKVQRIAITVE